ncbi:transposase [Xenorhabdus szentirmaii]|nr:transposase [Xenorhabdus szentirmaii]
MMAYKQLTETEKYQIFSLKEASFQLVEFSTRYFSRYRKA